MGRWMDSVVLVETFRERRVRFDSSSTYESSEKTHTSINHPHTKSRRNEYRCGETEGMMHDISEATMPPDFHVAGPRNLESILCGDASSDTGRSVVVVFVFIWFCGTLAPLTTMQTSEVRLKRSVKEFQSHSYLNEIGTSKHCDLGFRSLPFFDLFFSSYMVQYRSGAVFFSTL